MPENNLKINIVIHRGVNQIGGCITEVATDHTRIIIDFGNNLPGSKEKELTQKEISQLTNGIDAIFYTHYHADHIGQFALVPNTVQQYIGEGALEVMKCKYRTLSKTGDFMQELCALNRMKTYKPDCLIQIGDINITPYYCSHSAFDAYMFKIQANRKTILHTGDFRQHGYLGQGLKGTLRKFIGQVDVLISEGTMLGRLEEKVLTENEIKRNTAEVLKKHKYVYALCSSTDMERLASFHAACMETGRKFVCDKYQKSILDIFAKHGKSKSLFGFEQAFTYPHKETEKVIGHLRHHGFLYVVRGSQEWLIKKRMETYNDEPAYLVYSMWQGYHNGEEAVRLPNVMRIRDIFGNRIFDGTKDGFHTSGHAELQTLHDVCMITQPKTGVVFIHKDATSSPQSLHLPANIQVINNNDNNVEFIIASDDPLGCNNMRFGFEIG